MVVVRNSIVIIRIYVINGYFEGLQCDEIMHLFGDEFPSSKAKELGTYLNISHVILQDFSHNNMGNVKGMMIDVLNYWLETDPRKSWTKLAEAVEDCGYGVLADKIRSLKSNNGKLI